MSKSKFKWSAARLARKSLKRMIARRRRPVVTEIIGADRERLFLRSVADLQESGAR